MKRILVFGRGVLGTKLAAHGDDFILMKTPCIGPSLPESAARLIKETGADALVNAAGLSGTARCVHYGAVMSANVKIPVQLEGVCHMMGIPFIQPSTSGVYLRSDRRARQHEMAPLYPHNLYVASKILMERALSRAYVLRFGFLLGGESHKDDFHTRSASWTKVTDGWSSFMHVHILADYIREIARRGLHDIRCGIFNVASELAQMKSKVFGAKVIEESELDHGFTPASILDCGLADTVFLMNSYSESAWRRDTEEEE